MTTKKLDFENAIEEELSTSSTDFMTALAELSEQEGLEPISGTETGTNRPAKAKPVKNKWTSKHYPLFKLPLVEVYLKGFNPNLPDQPSLEEALKACIVTPLGPALKHSALRLNLLEDLKAFKATLYTNQQEIKNWQIGLVDSCIKEGLAVELDQCISKDKALARLQNYWNDRANELAKLGFHSIDDYKEALANAKSNKSLKSPNIEDLDW